MRPSSLLETHLYQRFGEDALVILEMIAVDGALAECPIDGQPYVAAEFLYCARFEMVTSLIDLLTRRTRAHLHDARATLAGAPAVASLVAADMDWNDDDVHREFAAYELLVRRELNAAGLAL